MPACFTEATTGNTKEDTPHRTDAMTTITVMTTDMKADIIVRITSIGSVTGMIITDITAAHVINIATNGRAPAKPRAHGTTI